MTFLRCRGHLPADRGDALTQVNNLRLIGRGELFGQSVDLDPHQLAALRATRIISDTSLLSDLERLDD